MIDPERGIRPEDIILDIYEETVQDAYSRILFFLKERGFGNLAVLLNTGLIRYITKGVLAIEYYNAEKIGFYLFVFKNTLMKGKNSLYYIPPRSNINVIAVGVNARNSYNTLKWPTIARCLRDPSADRKSVV